MWACPICTPSQADLGSLKDELTSLLRGLLLRFVRR